MALELGGREIAVVEEVKRQCCDPKRDLVKVVKSQHENSLYWFCRHCGRHWHERYVKNGKFGHFDGAPFVPRFEPVPFPWEK